MCGVGACGVRAACWLSGRLPSLALSLAFEEHEPRQRRLQLRLHDGGLGCRRRRLAAALLRQQAAHACFEGEGEERRGLAQALGMLMWLCTLVLRRAAFLWAP